MTKIRYLSLSVKTSYDAAPLKFTDAVIDYPGAFVRIAKNNTDDTILPVSAIISIEGSRDHTSRRKIAVPHVLLTSDEQCDNLLIYSFRDDTPWSDKQVGWVLWYDAIGNEWTARADLLDHTDTWQDATAEQVQSLKQLLSPVQRKEAEDFGKEYRADIAA